MLQRRGDAVAGGESATAVQVCRRRRQPAPRGRVRAPCAACSPALASLRHAPVCARRQPPCRPCASACGDGERREAPWRTRPSLRTIALWRRGARAVSAATSFGVC